MRIGVAGAVLFGFAACTTTGSNTATTNTGSGFGFYGAKPEEPRGPIRRLRAQS